MKKSQKEKQQDYFLEDIRDQIKDKLENDARTDNDLMFLAVMKIVPKMVDNMDWNEKILDFTKKYEASLNEIEKLQPSSELLDSYQMYCYLICTYYLLTEEKGKKIFEQLLVWFPSKKGKETIATWPTTFIASLFRPIELEGVIYFEDIRTKERYKMILCDEEIINEIKSFRSPFLSLLVPSNKEYVTDTILETETFSLIDPAATKNLSKKDWEEHVFHWYKDNLLKSVRPEHSSFEDENVKFYSAGRLMNETDFDFANRLIEQDKILREFPYIDQLMQLLVKTIQTFPQLFLNQVNVLPLLDAIKILFTDLDMDLTAERNYSNHQGHLWLMLIAEYLAEEVTSIQNYRVAPEFWQMEV
ncbi:hypothetical protein LQF61_02100 [Tetragenococcus koreensis]|uniref:hypothetical protein n=1 Tax=Tetragenococcus koreensis TaxID=290335 RepID=UPI001F2CC117|nr:hypothetical protein [Tetragenococcus koreensis]MCF1586108.1 hypothetical protein [Tetragenococcus koreensis]MCF1615695.1 hypothetical protein [Tetragenococcus koreensis]MCF1618869.1 hypothetical protein [Tetragenococcus koreensis]MCF1625492.1 hypothetical protein [Tetragenococcus koreensis]MCF1630381.1 hypothetical protein [Tetragenococcus koreensis]